MKTVNWLTGVCFLCAVATAISHPSSGIVVYEQKEMFFVHSGRGLAKLDQAGNLAYPHQSTDGHWLCLDPNGSFSRTQSKHFDQQVNRGHAVPSFGFGKWWNASDPTLHLCGIRSFAAKHSRMKRSVKIMN